MDKKVGKRLRCSYHSCDSYNSFFECEYCHKFFCQAHRDGVPPSTPFGSDHDTWALDGHPCPQSVETIFRQEELKKVKEQEALNNLLAKPRLTAHRHVQEINEKKFFRKDKPGWNDKFKKSDEKAPLGLILFFLFILGIGIGFFVFIFFPQNNQQELNKNVSVKTLDFIGPIDSFFKNLTNGITSNEMILIGPTPLNTTELEIIVHNLINSERIKHGLIQLRFDSNLSEIARRHSVDMASKNYFAHVNQEAKDATGRAFDLGYICRKDYGNHFTYGIAENIFQNNLYTSVTYYNGIPRYNWQSINQIASSTVDGWMTSPGHRENILTSTYDREGIGIAVSKDDKVYITEDFC